MCVCACVCNDLFAAGYRQLTRAMPGSDGSAIAFPNPLIRPQRARPSSRMRFIGGWRSHVCLPTPLDHVLIRIAHVASSHVADPHIRSRARILIRCCDVKAKMRACIDSSHSTCLLSNVLDGFPWTTIIITNEIPSVFSLTRTFVCIFMKAR